MNTRLSFFVIMAAIIFGMSVSPLAMPPSKEVIERLKSEGRFEKYLQTMAQARLQGVDAPRPIPGILKQKSALGAPTIYRSLVILIDFPDKPYTAGWAAATPTMFDSLLFSTSENPTGSMKEYYIENSYGDFILEGDVFGWYQASQPASYYTNYCDGSHGFGSYPNNAQRLVEEALAAADPYVNFAQYDNDNDGYVDGIFIVHSGTAFEESGNDCELHSHVSGINTQLRDGKYISTYSMEPEESASEQRFTAIGVYCHEFGHVLGLPDLYDYDDSSRGCGYWCLMATGSYNGQSKVPSHLSIWCKAQLGWVNPTNIMANQTNLSLPAIETSAVGYRLWRQGQIGSEYFLVENRRRIGFDAYLPGTGLLVWHIDESVFSNEDDWHPIVMLEQADGRFDLQYDFNGGDGSDPFPNDGYATYFHDKTTPGSRAYNSTATQVAIWNISPPGPTMTADFDVTWSRPYFRLSNSAFSDVTGGNGNGILEAGETIDLIFTVANDWKAAQNTSVTLSIDNGNLTITNGTVSLGGIASGGTANNNSNPMQFTIPLGYTPRIDSFFLTVNSDGGLYGGILPIEKSVGKPILLLVDDDNNDIVDTFFTNVLRTRRTPFDKWTVFSQGAPSSATLQQYPAVFWSTGDYQAAPLTGGEITAMTGYMDNAGNLFLSGQGIAQQLSTFDPAFLANYLRCNYVTNTRIPIVIPEPGGPVMSGLDTISIQGQGSAGNATKPDHLTPVNGGASEGFYMTTPNKAAISYNGSYKLLYFGFGLECLPRYDDRWEKRDTVLNHVLMFLGVPATTGYPGVGALTVGPGLAVNLIDHTPMFTWSYSDGGGQPQQRYEIQVGSDLDWGIAEMWNPGQVVNSDSTVEFAGGALQDGRTYFYRLRVYNGSQWSPWRMSQYRMNALPSAPIISSPKGGAPVSSTTPTLTIINSIDPENDPTWYDFQVADDLGMSNLIDQGLGVYMGGGITSWTVTVTLIDQRTYYWRSRAFDGYEYGPWTSPESFWLNTVNHPPSAFTLIAPINQTMGLQTPVTFRWHRSIESDPLDSVKYTIYYSLDSLFTAPEAVSGLNDTLYVRSAAFSPGKYYWRVGAFDKSLAVTMSTFFHFTVNGTGDANGDGSTNVGDAVFLIGYIFKSGTAPSPLSRGDINGDCGVNVGDPVYLINYIFKGGPSPQPGC